MKPLGQPWGGRGWAQVGGRGSGRGGEVGPPAPPPPSPTRPQRAPLRGSLGGWRGIRGARGWRSDPGLLFWARELRRGFVAGARRPGRYPSQRGGSEGSPGAQPPPRHSLSGLEGLQSCCSSHPGPPPRSFASSPELPC